MDQSMVKALQGSTVRSADGVELGKVMDVYIDEDTGRARWVTVRTGRHGKKESFVPLRAARQEGRFLHVDETAERVSGAPQIDQEGTLSERHEREIYSYYKIEPGSETDGLDLAGAGAGAGGGGGSGRGVAGGSGLGSGGKSSGRSSGGSAGKSGGASGGKSGGGDDAMTRSEERLVAGTEQRQAGRVRLRKYVETETEQVEVPVQREKVRVEREPITEANAGDALSGPEITEQEHEVTLREERPVVGKETVPTERVRLEKETVTDTETVSGDVRKERIEVEGEAGRR